MGEKYLLANDKLVTWLETLRQSSRLIAPVERAGELCFDYVTSDDQVVLGAHNTRRSPKWVFFPQTERLLRYGTQLDDYGKITEVSVDETPAILLGTAPCDTRSFLMMDRIFCEGAYQDPYYSARRVNTLVISVACARPTPTCFCHAFGSGPADTTGADIMLHPAGDAYIVEPISEAGALAASQWQLPQADQEHLAQSETVAKAAIARLKPVTPVDGIEQDLAGLFDSSLWKEVAEKCIACGTCTYNCPECHCFNIVDNQLSSGGERGIV